MAGHEDPPGHVNPARAGMIRSFEESLEVGWRKPRASGDDPHEPAAYCPDHA